MYANYLYYVGDVASISWCKYTTFEHGCQVF